jgi:hypothetical protein
MKTWTMSKQIFSPEGQPPGKPDADSLANWVKEQLESREIALRDNLRWEDDGGRIVGVYVPIRFRQVYPTESTPPSGNDDRQRRES